MAGKALLFLFLLTSAAFAISDCELCQTIEAIYGACSPELVANYANQTGLTVEWICLTDAPIEGDPEHPNPITAFGMENNTIKIFSPTRGNVHMFPDMENFVKWGASYDPKTGTIGWYIVYNSTSAALSRTPSVKFKIYAPFTLSKEDTKVGTADMFVNFSSTSTMSKAVPTAYGYDVEIALTSRAGTQNISGTIGLISSCSWVCLDPRDFIQCWGECSGCTNVLIGNTFTYFRGKVDDIYNTCTLVAGSRCTQYFKYNGDGSVQTIPTSDATKKIDCNGAACTQSITSISGTWYYRYPKCRNVDSGHIVRTEFDTTGLISGNRDYSCVAPATTQVTPIIEEEESSRIDYMPYLGGLGIFALVGAGWATSRPKKKKEEEDEA